MADLTEQQKQAVAGWAAGGATLNDIQSRLKEEFNLVLTYFDTRLLVMGLGLNLKDKKREETAETNPESASNPQVEDEDAVVEEFDDGYLMPEEPETTGKVSVTLDTLAVPGTMASGKVTFSDGTNASWHLDQYGRLGLRDAPMGYQPPPQDIPGFQQELQKLLR